MIIKTKNLIIKPNGTKNLETTHIYSSDLDTTKYMYYLPNHSLDETLNFLEEVEKEWQKEDIRVYEFAIFLNDKHIGAISLSLIDEEKGELGWIINKNYQHQGYGYEAALEMIELAKKINLKKVIAHCDTQNIPSYHLMEKLQMKRVKEQDRIYPDKRGQAKEYMYERIL